MMSFSTSWSVSVTMSVDELFAVTALSRCKALRAIYKFANNNNKNAKVITPEFSFVEESRGMVCFCGPPLQKQT